MENEEKSKSTGCLIFFVLAVIGYIIYVISNTNKSQFADVGQGLMVMVSLAVAFFILKAIGSMFSSDNSSSSSNSNHNQDGGSFKGCLGIILVVVLFLFIFGLLSNVLTSSQELNMGIGITITVVAIIAIAIFIFKNLD